MAANFKSRLIDASFGYRVEARSRARKDPFKSDNPANRWVLLVVLIILFAFVSLGRLVDLQVVSGAYYRSLAEGNRIRRIPVKAGRGEVLDRNGQVLARNTPVYKLATFTSGGVVESTAVISREEALKIQAEQTEEAARLLIDSGREYPLGEIAAHVVGYVNEAAPEEIGKMSNDKCQMTNTQQVFQYGDLVGRMGVEAYYDCVLRGINGEELIEVDARGVLVRRIGRKEPIPGKSIRLALDANLQKLAYQALLDATNEKGSGLLRDQGEVVRGAVVVARPESGEVLALVSLPSFDPNLLKDKYTEYANDKNLPFFNRAISGAYHPGSTYKLVVATAGIQEGKLDSNFNFKDEGFIELGGTIFRNWLFVKRGGVEGEIGLVRAITRSTDTFFYKAGEILGVDALVLWSKKFGIGVKTGVDLPGEIAGLLPTPEWKEKVKQERWYLGNTYNMSIGQGDLTTTPVQILAMTSVFANGGRLCVPGVALQNPNCQDLGLKEESLSLVRQGMVGACSPGGTAGQFFNFEPRVACKTGTAQFIEDKTHAWFTAFAPANADAQITATVLVEGGGEGSVVAAPLVKKIFENYFNK